MEASSQLVCSGCRVMLSHPRDADSVVCARCNAVMQVPHLPMSHLVCGGCHNMLMYLVGVPDVRCSICHLVNPCPSPARNRNSTTNSKIQSTAPSLFGDGHHLVCGGCRCLLQYGGSGQQVVCAVCHYINPCPTINTHPHTPVNANPCPPGNVNPRPPANPDPSPPVSADPSPPVSANPNPPGIANPSPPGNANPSSPANANPSRPVSADPSPAGNANPAPPIHAKPCQTAHATMCITAGRNDSHDTTSLVPAQASGGRPHHSVCGGCHRQRCADAEEQHQKECSVCHHVNKSRPAAADGDHPRADLVDAGSDANSRPPTGTLQDAPTNMSVDVRAEPINSRSRSDPASSDNPVYPSPAIHTTSTAAAGVSASTSGGGDSEHDRRPADDSDAPHDQSNHLNSGTNRINATSAIANLVPPSNEPSTPTYRAVLDPSSRCSGLISDVCDIVCLTAPTRPGQGKHGVSADSHVTGTNRSNINEQQQQQRQQRSEHPSSAKRRRTEVAGPEAVRDASGTQQEEVNDEALLTVMGETAERQQAADTSDGSTQRRPLTDQ